MNIEFKKAIETLTKTTEDFKAGNVSPMVHAYVRGDALCAAVLAMAQSCGVALQPMRIDSRGELMVTTHGIVGAAGFGESFSALLNTANPRCGLAPGPFLLPESTWCRLNHFNAEKLVMDFHAKAI